MLLNTLRSSLFGWQGQWSFSSRDQLIHRSTDSDSQSLCHQPPGHSSLGHQRPGHWHVSLLGSDSISNPCRPNKPPTSRFLGLPPSRNIQCLHEATLDRVLPVAMRSLSITVSRRRHHLGRQTGRILRRRPAILPRHRGPYYREMERAESIPRSALEISSSLIRTHSLPPH